MTQESEAQSEQAAAAGEQQQHHFFLADLRAEFVAANSDELINSTKTVLSSREISSSRGGAKASCVKAMIS